VAALYGINPLTPHPDSTEKQILLGRIAHWYYCCYFTYLLSNYSTPLPTLASSITLSRVMTHPY
jgi:hypothetical protein